MKLFLLAPSVISQFRPEFTALADDKQNCNKVDGHFCLPKDRCSKEAVNKNATGCGNSVDLSQAQLIEPMYPANVNAG